MSPQDPYRPWTSLYGAAFQLADGWLDRTAYTFEIAHDQLRAVSWTREKFNLEQTTRWLAQCQKEAAGFFGPGSIGPLQTYAHPVWPVHGFVIALGQGDHRLDYHVLGITRSSDTLCVRCKVALGGAGVFAAFLASVSPRVVGERPHPAETHVYDVSFRVAAQVNPPDSFVFGTADESGSLEVAWASEHHEIEPPLWSTRFSFPPEARIQIVGHTRSSAAHPLALPVPGGRTSGISCCDWEAWEAFAATDQERISLYCAEARSSYQTRELRLSFRVQGDTTRAQADFVGMLESLRSED